MQGASFGEGGSCHSVGIVCHLCREFHTMPHRVTVPACLIDLWICDSIHACDKSVLSPPQVTSRDSHPKESSDCRETVEQGDLLRRCSAKTKVKRALSLSSNVEPATETLELSYATRPSNGESRLSTTRDEVSSDIESLTSRLATTSVTPIMRVWFVFDSG